MKRKEKQNNKEIEQPSTDVGGCDKLSYSIRMLKKLTQDLLSRSAEESK